MNSNLYQVIFEQFLDILQQASKRSCPDFDRCAFNYTLVPPASMNIIYVYRDECCRPRNIVTTIDVANICYNDLCQSKWIEYLTRTATNYVYEICPKKYVIPVCTSQICPDDPPKWTPYPTKLTTTVIQEVCPEPEPEECIVVNETICPCLPICPRKFNSTPRQYVVKKVAARPNFVCGEGFTSLVEETREKYNDYKGVLDYNSHAWSIPSQDDCCANQASNNGSVVTAHAH